MKKLFLLVFIIPLIMFQGCKQAKPVTLHVTVGDKICQSSQWVYWFSLVGNEYNIVDSCFLAKGQHSFTMKKVIPDMNVDMFCWLTFTKHGPLQTFMMLNKEEDVKLIIKNHQFPKTEGSPEMQEYYDFWRKTREVRIKIDSMTRALMTTKDTLFQRHLEYNIKTLQDSLDFKLRLDVYKNLKTPKMFLFELNAGLPGFPRKTFDSLVTVMKQRFPNNKRVQEYPQRPKYPPATLHSKLILKRFQQILAERTGHSFKRPVTPKLSTEQKKALCKIQALKPGDKVTSLSFKGQNGKNIALKDIHTPYVLIDFWASWCTPCREEMPDLKLVQANYKGKLTVYAVSLDENKSNWRRAIRIDKSNMLTQVIIDSSQFIRKKTQTLFGIKFIPRNFLLDQHRKIIAINIPGDSLEKKLGKLCR